MGGLTLLDEARTAGLTVAVDGDKLVIRGPRSEDASARRLIAAKADVIAALQPKIPAAIDWEASRPDETDPRAMARWWLQRYSAAGVEPPSAMILSARGPATFRAEG